jgi:hypothetical protein
MNQLWYSRDREKTREKKRKKPGKKKRKRPEKKRNPEKTVCENNFKKYRKIEKEWNYLHSRFKMRSHSFFRRRTSPKALMLLRLSIIRFTSVFRCSSAMIDGGGWSTPSLKIISTHAHTTRKLHSEEEIRCNNRWWCPLNINRHSHNYTQSSMPSGYQCTHHFARGPAHSKMTSTTPDMHHASGSNTQ